MTNRPYFTPPLVGGGVQGELGFFVRFAIAKEVLQEFDNSLAIATSGGRTLLLLQEHPPTIRPSIFPIFARHTVVELVESPKPGLLNRGFWRATKEYLNQRCTKIRVFRVCFRAPFLPPFFPHFSPLFALQALFTLPPLLPSSPPPLSSLC